MLTFLRFVLPIFQYVKRPITKLNHMTVCPLHSCHGQLSAELTYLGYTQSKRPRNLLGPVIPLKWIHMTQRKMSLPINKFTAKKPIQEMGNSGQNKSYPPHL